MWSHLSVRPIRYVGHLEAIGVAETPELDPFSAGLSMVDVLLATEFKLLVPFGVGLQTGMGLFAWRKTLSRNEIWSPQTHTHTHRLISIKG